MDVNNRNLDPTGGTRANPAAMLIHLERVMHKEMTWSPLHERALKYKSVGNDVHKLRLRSISLPLKSVRTVINLLPSSFV